MNWKVISFYTANYKDEVDILIKSLDQLKIPYDIEFVKSKGLWKENTFYKIPFIIKKLKQSKTPLVWLDADAGVVQYPVLFDDMGDALMGGVYSPWKTKGVREFISNTMYFVPCKETINFLEEINNFIKNAPDAYDHKMIGEQWYMQMVLEANNWKERMKFRELPYTYGMAFYWKKSKLYNLCTEACVITQRQASRRKNPIKIAYYKHLGLEINDVDEKLMMENKKEE